MGLAYQLLLYKFLHHKKKNSIKKLCCDKTIMPINSYIIFGYYDFIQIRKITKMYDFLNLEINKVADISGFKFENIIPYEGRNYSHFLTEKHKNFPFVLITYIKLKNNKIKNNSKKLEENTKNKYMKLIFNHFGWSNYIVLTFFKDISEISLILEHLNTSFEILHSISYLGIDYNLENAKKNCITSDKKINIISFLRSLEYKKNKQLFENFFKDEMQTNNFFYLIGRYDYIFDKSLNSIEFLEYVNKILDFAAEKKDIEKITSHIRFT